MKYFLKSSPLGFQDPVRSEIFGASRMDSHAESLARAQTIQPRASRKNFLTGRLAENQKVLETAYLEILRAVEDSRAITPAGEWFIDNFHIVRAQLHDIHDHLPPKYYRRLPKLADGPFRDLPRVYGIAWAYVAHTDSRLDPEGLVRFLRSYQRVEPLTIGELWAVSLTLRVVLIENLRRLAERIASSQRSREEADLIANEILGLIDTPVRPLPQLIASLDGKDLTGAFLVQLLQRLRFQGTRFDPVLEWLDQRIASGTQSPDELVATEHNSQTAANATVKNIITSSRLITTFDWQGFFEEVSLVETTLRKHPGYSAMDFVTRNRYQHAIEELAEHSSVSEVALAEMVLAECQAARAKGENVDERLLDPGHYLISFGRFQLEAKCGFRAPLSLRVRRFYMRSATPLYLGGIGLLTALLWCAPLFFFPHAGVAAWLLALLALVPVSQIALGLMNRFTIAWLGPRHLPRLRLEDGVPTHMRSFVVVPTLFLEESRIEEQLEQLEIYYLANPRGDVYFALLSDWRDADTESLADDETLLEIARRRLQRLNEKHGPTPAGFDRFYIFHRRRIFNAREGKWMGWERKRGKLEEFNGLLRGRTEHSFVPGENAPPPDVKYVITLDADTRLPNGSLVQLVGAMAHPLNRPRFDKKIGRVVSGYGILQPRVTPTLPTGREATVFQHLSTGPSGIDPYASAISDVYQDLFGEGSFTGKGIYDVDAFAQALAGKTPENALLSHDLFEGNFARCGFLSDVEVFEDFPWHSSVAAARTHRWIRGDWQLLPWILGRSGSAITAIGRWKMIDNLRRSLLPTMAFGTIVLALANPHGVALLWLTLGVLSQVSDSLISTVAGVWPDRRDSSFGHHFRAMAQNMRTTVQQALLSLVLLPFHAFTNADAILRALYRLLISGRHMLEWTTAAQVKRSAGLALGDFFWGMRWALVLSAGAMAALARAEHASWRVSLPFLFFWLSSPLLAKLASTPFLGRAARPLRAEEIQLLNASARRIWRFFATFVTAQDHHLPPDNFQESPEPVVAHRSSPTNFGLYLLSALAARDFGWIGLTELSERLARSLESMRDLPRFQGHFYNWYETSDRRALEPRYISSVDNGNLAGHLLALARGADEYLERFSPVLGLEPGIVTTYLLLKDAAVFLVKKGAESSTAERELLLCFDALSDALFSAGPGNSGFSYWINLEEAAIRLACMTEAVGQQDPQYQEISTWSAAIRADIESHNRDLRELFPWLEFTELKVPVAQSVLWANVRARISAPVNLLGAVAHAELLLEDLAEFRRQLRLARLPEPAFLPGFMEVVETGIRNVHALQSRLWKVKQLCHQLVQEMNFGLLYDPVRKLFSIGFRVAENELDQSFYDLMASEARLTSFVAIAKGDVPVAHWFRLGRSLTKVGGGAVLLSWSGSMFEYLMPSLVMHAPEGSLMEQTIRLVVRKQIQYGRESGVPWGVSESAYNKRDLQLTYQYSNFGVPDLGLKRGLGEDLVIAPYATFLAAMVDPAAAVENLRRLTKEGGLGAYGYFEAIDYTASRLPVGTRLAPVKAYMAHHQGMSLVAVANILNGQAMRNRFHSEPMIQAAGMLLQERTPKNVTVTNTHVDSFHVGLVREETDHAVRHYHDVNRPIPTTQLLSNGEYSVMLTSSGSGFSRCRDLAVTRWREDVTLDNWGTYFYLRDTETGAVWSAGHQPVGVAGDSYEVTFSEDRVHYVREIFGIASDLEVFVSPEENAEVRRITLVNKGLLPRDIEITSYAEVCLTTPAADAAHPAFSNLFVQSEFVPSHSALLTTRRPRSAKESPPWMAQVVCTDRNVIGDLEWESDRAKFIGRNRSVRNPRALDKGAALSNTTGPVLDPVSSIRTRVRLAPDMPCHISFSTLMAKSREEALGLAEKFRDPAHAGRVSDLAWTQAQVKLHYLGIEPDEANLFQRLGARLLFLDSSLRPSAEIIQRSTKDLTGLWSMGISGDHPILLLRVEGLEDRGIVRQLLRAQDYFGTKRFTVDLVILNDKASSYSQEVQAQLEAMAKSGSMAAHSPVAHSKGAVFVLRSDLLSQEDRILLYASARAVISSRQGSLAEQVRRAKPTVPAVQSPRVPNPWPASPVPLVDPKSLLFFQGLGGFSPDGKEYVIALNPGDHTPAPWVNVIANPSFGFQVSESGAGYTWSGNSRENQLTPWTNDPVCDPSGEAFYLYDREAGVHWSPTASPVRQPNGSYLARHGQGYSRFEHQSHGIGSTLTQFVPLDSPVKISRLAVTNHSRSTRKIAVTHYVEWTLGFSRPVTAPGTLTEFDEESGALFALNPRSNEFGNRPAFLAASLPIACFTADRTEFLGRNGSRGKPEGVFRAALSNRTGAAFDPCGALQCLLEIPPGKTVEVAFFLGEEKDRGAARELLQNLRRASLDELFQKVAAFWDKTLGAVQVRTPDEPTNLLLNRWLLYQTTVCRFWARAAFYQAGGAYGFRDQLQDVLALLYSQPAAAREHILRAASRQFLEGDVQHWWHPPLGRGVRTHFSDDLLWLPFVVFQYLQVTQDRAILDAEASFLEGPLVPPDREDSYFTPTSSHNSASLYEHCARALDRSLAVGAHGLPLMGAGDWNDGMNRVGQGGKGESVWLAWFLIANLRQFAVLAQSRGEHSREGIWRAHADRLAKSMEELSWDGEWYRRAYFDDGTPLGSASEEECQIDSLTQTWAVISRAAEGARAQTAMNSVDERLVKEADKMILLFTPPFNLTPHDPGYIRGYLPGVRENGGQYTHAATWCVVAQAMLGNGRRAFELFSMLNPINHARDSAGMELYKVEPYVLAADVYSEPPHRGRGGWTWYTGSCAWMYRAGIEYLCGLKIRGSKLSLNPCIPPEWPEFDLSYRFGKSEYRITVKNPQRLSSGTVLFAPEHAADNPFPELALVDDAQIHRLVGTLTPGAPER